jgi:predicted Ser/Thr protein kinase
MRMASGGFDRPEEGPSLVGEQLGRFRVERQIGQGGMATVYLARQAEIGSKVAVKVLKAGLCDHPALVEQFKAEATAVNLIGHPHIVNIFDLDVLPDGRPYMVMEYLDGVPLSEVLKAGALPPAQAVELLLQICAALGATHAKGVIHRDLKADNLFVIDHGEGGGFVKVLDFGLAQLKAGAQAASELVMGTPSYMAPEQWQNGPVDARTDIYALGVLAWRMLVGRAPFTGNLLALSVAHRHAPPPLPHAHNPAVSEALSAVVLRALAKDPAHRFQSVEALACALREAQPSPGEPPLVDVDFDVDLVDAPGAAAQAPLPPPLPPPLPSARPAPARRRRVAVAASAALLTALFTAGALGWHHRDAQVGRLLAMATSQVEQGRLGGAAGNSALELLVQARELRPSDARVGALAQVLSDTFFRLGEAAAARGDLAEAAVHFEAALQASPGRQDARRQLTEIEDQVRLQVREAVGARIRPRR